MTKARGKLPAAAGTVLVSAGTIAFFSLLSRALGLLRDRLLAGQFGAGPELDAYYAAFKVPDFLYNLLVLGALTAAFVPVVAGYLAKGQREQANRTTGTVLVVLAVVLGLLSLGALIFLPQLISLTAPGFTGATRELTLQLTRVMLLSPIIFGISSVVSSYLNTTRRFLAYAIAPVLYNVGIVIGIVWLVPLYGAMGLAYGVLLGASLHLLVQIPALIRAGFRPRVGSLRDPGVIRILKLAGPRLLSIAALQVNVVVVTAIATTLLAGTVAAYNLAFNLQSLPLGAVGLSLATAAFPWLAEAASKNDGAGFTKHLTQTLRQLLFLIVPLSAGLILLRVEVVDLAFGTGSFDVLDTYETAAALGVFAISLFAQSAVPLLARGFYALEDTRTPVAISVVSVALNLILAWTVGRHFGALGLAATFSIAAAVDFLLHLLLLRGRLGSLDDVATLRSLGRTVLATALGGAALFSVRWVLGQVLPTSTFAEVLIVTLGSLLAGGLVYVLAHALMKSVELREVTSLFTSRLGKLKPR